MNIKAIIFDFGRVLADFDHMKSCKLFAEFSDYTAEEIYNIIFRNGTEKSFEEGKIDSEKFYQLVIREIGAKNISYSQFSQIWGDIFIENKGIEDVLRKIKDDIRMLILSNTNEIHWRYVQKLPVIRKYFPRPDLLLLSFQLGVRKPHRRIYNSGIRKTGVDPSEIIYVDDKKQFVSDFSALGAHGINYDCQKHSIKTLEAALYQKEVLEDFSTEKSETKETKAMKEQIPPEIGKNF